MRIDIDDFLADYFEVFLDGKLLTRCVMADETLGICEIRKEFTKDMWRFDKYPTIILKGKVDIYPKKELWEVFK